MLYLAFTWKDIQMIFNLTISGWKIAAEVFKYIYIYPSADVSTWKWHGSVAERWFQWCWLIKLLNCRHIWYLCHLIILDPRWHTDFRHKQQATWTNWPPKAVSAGDMVGPCWAALWAEKRLGDGQKVGRWRVAGLLTAVAKEHGHGWPCSTALNSSLQDFRCGHWMHLFLGTQTELEQVQLTKFAESDFTNFLSIVFGTFGQFPLILGSPKKQVRHPSWRTAPPRAPESPGISGEPLVIKHCTGKYPTHGGVHGK